jgi:hypothetical protein
MIEKITPKKVSEVSHMVLANTFVVNEGEVEFLIFLHTANNALTILQAPLD